MTLRITYHLMNRLTVVTESRDEEFDVNKQSEELVKPDGLITCQQVNEQGRAALVQIPTRTIAFVEIEQIA